MNVIRLSLIYLYEVEKNREVPRRVSSYYKMLNILTKEQFLDDELLLAILRRKTNWLGLLGKQ